MFVGVLTVDLSIPYLETIKERRNILRSIKDMVRKKFNVSIADVTEGEEITNRVKIAVSAVSGDSGHVQSVLGNVFNLIENFHPEKVLTYKTDIMLYE
jgi:uncharacterized protein YlxP (DUF503 family)